MKKTSWISFGRKKIKENIFCKKKHLKNCSAQQLLDLLLVRSVDVARSVWSLAILDTALKQQCV
jgi:hypothetical protein